MTKSIDFIFDFGSPNAYSPGRCCRLSPPVTARR
jgi:2-hydroxychromene-2-carboxylate isomerase